MKIKMVVILVIMLLITLPILSAIEIQTCDSEYILSNSGTDDWTQQAKLIASDGEINDKFGISVSINGDYAFVGAFTDDGSKGSVYVYKSDGSSWNQIEKLTSSDLDYRDYFGDCVSVDGDYAIIGAPGNDDNGDSSGSAYIFKRDGPNWFQQEKLLPSDGVAGDLFGVSVSISGDYVIIGAEGTDIDTGSAYIFKRYGSDWIEQDKITASDGSEDDEFGVSVSLDGDYAVIGAHYYNSNMGSAYIFKRYGSDWIQQAQLLALDGENGDFFGYSVSLYKKTALIGAYGDGDNGYRSGSAYLFMELEEEWKQISKITPSDGVAGDYFGYSVSIGFFYAIIGARRDDGGTGSAYIFKRDPSWSEDVKLTASDGEIEDIFGISVSMYRNYVIVGAVGDDQYIGSAYIYNKFNLPPDTPTISGPVNGIPDTDYWYYFHSDEPDGDYVCYYIDWGDGDVFNWGFWLSPNLSLGLPHSWSELGTYIIKVKTKDIFEEESDWAQLEVTIPRNKVINRPILNILQNHPNLFPILQRLLQRLGLLK
jgi:hypothetical protein